MIYYQCQYLKHKLLRGIISLCCSAIRRITSRGRLANRSMISPQLERLRVIPQTYRNPCVAVTAKNTLRLDLSYSRFVHKDHIAILRRVRVLGAMIYSSIILSNPYRINDYLHSLTQATLAMGVPGNRTIGRVGSQTDPLIARCT